jgi:hypothetical protein
MLLSNQEVTENLPTNAVISGGLALIADHIYQNLKRRYEPIDASHMIIRVEGRIVQVGTRIRNVKYWPVKKGDTVVLSSGLTKVPEDGVVVHYGPTDRRYIRNSFYTDEAIEEIAHYKRKLRYPDEYE